MLLKLLLPECETLHLEAIHTDDQMIRLDLRACGAEAPCPSCGTMAHRVHSRYHRQPSDLAWAQVPVRLRLQVRRFRCEEQRCKQRIFAERFPDVVAPAARRTQRLEKSLCAVALALGGQAGSRLAAKLGMSSSPNTLLRIIRRAPLPLPVPSAAIGIDDWAWRKGRRYGTIIVDLASHQVLDLLPEVKREPLKVWLQTHPGLAIISRDRGGPFATAATEAAPQAIQVADRFHLLQNLSGVLKHVLERHARQIDPVRLALPDAPPKTAPLSVSSEGELHCSPPTMQNTPTDSCHLEERASDVQVARTQRQQQRRARFEEAKRLKQLGMNHAQIARTLGVARKTVISWLKQPAYAIHPGAKSKGRPLGSILDPYKDYLAQRFHEGCQTASLLWREIQAQGYQGSDSLVRRFLRPLRAGSTIPTISQAKRQPRYSIPDLVFFVLRRDGKRTAEEERVVTQLRQVSESLQITCDLAEAFAAMLRTRQPDKLESWLQQAEESTLPEFRTFARGLRRDLAAVRAGLELSYSTGPVEGHIHRLKLIKRQMYGRANFDLLRRRVLLAV